MEYKALIMVLIVITLFALSLFVNSIFGSLILFWFGENGEVTKILGFYDIDGTYYLFTW